MFFSVTSVLMIGAGVMLLVLASPIVGLIRRRMGDKVLVSSRQWSLFYVWPTRFIGLLILVAGLWSMTTGPPQSFMKKAANRIALLEHGRVTEAVVKKAYYQRLAPEGWKLIYEFTLNDDETGEAETYAGSTQGPEDYYGKSKAGDIIDVIYYPTDPKVNSEIRCFINDPSLRHTFKKAGKLHLLDKFRGEYELKDYSFKEWFGQQQNK